MEEVLCREVELVHPWQEWIKLMERLHRYFDIGRAGGADEASMATVVSMDLSDISEEARFGILKYVCSSLLGCYCWRTEVSEEAGFDFSRDWTTVKNACMNFGRDRFDILKYVCCS